jgi:ketosteroid isomerase-like protein
MTTNPATHFPIDRVLAAFEKGDVPTLLGSIADDVDFRIDHYRDEADTSWQVARNKADVLAVVQRLGTEVFPQGTKIVHTHSQPLGDDWVITQFHQRFFYAVQQREVESLTWIVSHSRNGQLDYFRETVTTITPT